jgi:uncharacterized membrane protein YhiD involved in acid resistance
MKSWKTTTAGIGAILVAIGSALAAHFDGDASTVADWGAVIAAVIAGVGLLAARDNDKSSQDVGIR